MATKQRSKKKTAEAVESVALGSSDLMEMLTNGIRDLYWAENHLVQVLPKMKEAASVVELQDAIDEHLEITKEHVVRLQQVFQLLNEDPIARKCDAMEGLTLEGEGMIEDTLEGTAARNLGINVSCLKVEYYEMIAYQTLAKLATTLGLNEVSELLTDTLSEEEESAEILASIGDNITAAALPAN